MTVRDNRGGKRPITKIVRLECERSIYALPRVFPSYRYTTSPLVRKEGTGKALLYKVYGAEAQKSPPLELVADKNRFGVVENRE